MTIDAIRVIQEKGLGVAITMNGFLGCTASAGILAMAPLGASAQESVGTQPDDIVVTAQRRVEKLADVPLTVNVLSGADLQKKGVVSLQDLSAQVPGLDVFSSGGGKQQIQIRGVNSLRGTSSLVGMYLDETPLTGSQDGFNPVYADAGSLDLQRIEVLKGPQGTLFGEGAISGVVRYLTNDPKLQLVEAQIDATAFVTDGGAPSGQVKGALNLPVSETFALRIAGEYQANGGWLENVGTGERNVNSGEAYEGRIKALFQPGADLKIVGLVDIRRNHEDSPSYANVLPYEDGLYQRAVNTVGRTSGISNLDVFSLRVEYDFGFARLMSNTAHLDRYSNSNLDQRYYATNDPAAPIVLEIENSRYLNEQSITSQEMRLSSAGSGAWQWVIGGMYKDDSIRRQFLDGAVLLFPPSTSTLAILTEPITTRSKSWAAYADTSYLFAGRLEVGGGLRYYDDSRRFIDGGLPEASGSFRRVTYRGFVKYRLGEDANIYVNTGNGFRSGGFNAVVDPSFPPPLTYEPETATAYEAGVKASMFKSRLDFTIAAFQQYYRGQVYDRVVLTPTYLQFTANGGNTRIRGVEWLIAARPLPGLRLTAGGTIMGSVFLPSTPEAEADFQPGTNPLALPRYSVQFGGNYAFDWGSDVPGFIDVDFSQKAKLVGGQGVTRIVTGPQSFLSLNVGATFEKFELAVFARNILNEHDPYYPTLGGLGAVPRPRQIGVRVGRSF